ncbi:alpha-amylase family glycosyl hydrolase [Staphylococcus aureus]
MKIKGWNALFIENHYQPRRVSTWGDDDKYWYESVELMSLFHSCTRYAIHLSRSEIGMTNYPFESIETF